MKEYKRGYEDGKHFRKYNPPITENENEKTEYEKGYNQGSSESIGYVFDPNEENFQE